MKYDVDVEAYSSQMRTHILPYFDRFNLMLDHVTTQHIQDFYAYKIAEGISPNTVLHHHANLYSAFKYAMREDMIITNPMLKVIRPKKEHFDANFLSINQVFTLIQNSRDCRIYPAIVIAIFLGLRRSEIAGLQWNAIDFENKIISIKKRWFVILIIEQK